MSRSREISDNHADIIDGPVYQRAPEIAALVEPMLPSAAEMRGEFAAALYRAVDGVEISRATSGCQHLLVSGERGQATTWSRQRLYGRAWIDAISMPGKPWESSKRERWSRANVDAIRGAALAVARAFAQRVADQAVTLRMERCGARSALAEPRLEPIVVSCHEPVPMLLGANSGEPFICFEYSTCSIVAIYAAYYFVTPVSVPEKEST